MYGAARPRYPHRVASADERARWGGAGALLAINASLLAALVALIAASVAAPAARRALDLPLFVVSWAFLLVTPVVALTGLAAARRQLRGGRRIAALLVQLVALLLWSSTLFVVTCAPGLLGELGGEAPERAAAPQTAEEAERVAAWRRVDALFTDVRGWGDRSPLLAGIDEAEVERVGDHTRLFVYSRGVAEWAPAPDCDPEQRKCPARPRWQEGGGVYLSLRAHHNAHAAGAFDAEHPLGPLSIQVTLQSSDPALREALLAELAARMEAKR